MYRKTDIETLQYFPPLTTLALMNRNWFLFLACSAKLPTGLHILLALISYFYLFFLLRANYLGIYWTDFHNLFTKWKVFALAFLIRGLIHRHCLKIYPKTCPNITLG